MMTSMDDSIPSPFRSRDERLTEREQKREALLNVAVRLFNTKGFHAASLDEVAASLKISKPTIYYYLGNKEQVLLECLERGMKTLHAAAAEAEARSGSGYDRLHAFLLRMAENSMRDYGRCVIRTNEEALSPEGGKLFRALKSEIDHVIQSLIAAGIADGSIAPTDPKLAAFALASAVNGPANWYDPTGPLTPAQIAQGTVAVLTEGFRPRP